MCSFAARKFPKFRKNRFCPRFPLSSWPPLQFQSFQTLASLTPCQRNWSSSQLLTSLLTNLLTVFELVGKSRYGSNYVAQQQVKLRLVFDSCFLAQQKSEKPVEFQENQLYFFDRNIINNFHLQGRLLSKCTFDQCTLIFTKSTNVAYREPI